MLGVALGRVMLEIVKVNTLAGAERGEDGGRYDFIITLSLHGITSRW